MELLLNEEKSGPEDVYYRDRFDCTREKSSFLLTKDGVIRLSYYEHQLDLPLSHILESAAVKKVEKKLRITLVYRMISDI